MASIHDIPAKLVSHPELAVPIPGEQAVRPAYWQVEIDGVSEGEPHYNYRTALDHLLTVQAWSTERFDQWRLEHPHGVDAYSEHFGEILARDERRMEMAPWPK